MQDHWRTAAIAAAGAAVRALAARERRSVNGSGASPAFDPRPRLARVPSDAIRFTGARTQRQVSTYLLYRSFSADERNCRRCEWWREAQGHRDTGS